MKKIIIVVIVGLATIMAPPAGKARVWQRLEDANISLATTLGVAIPARKPAQTAFEWQLTGLYNLTERWAVGLGTGISFHEKVLLPIFADGRYQIGRERTLTPFAELAAGYAVGLSSGSRGGLMVNPSVGFFYRLPRGRALQFSVGYELQKFLSLTPISIRGADTELAQRVSRHSIALRLGVRF